MTSLRPPRPGEEATAQAVWEASSAHDDPGGRQRGGWSLTAWATEWRALTLDHDQLVGLVAIRAPDEGAVDIVHARMALDPAHRDGAAPACCTTCVSS